MTVIGYQLWCKKLPTLTALAAVLATAAPARAEWIANGVAVCDSCIPADHEIVPDGAGGFLTVWKDDRFIDVPLLYAQHQNADGTRYSGWPSTGLRVDTDRGYGDYLGQAFSDGAGGAMIAIQSDVDVYLQHVLADGGRPPGWPAGGIPVAVTADDERDVTTCPDGEGGAYLAYEVYPGGNFYLSYVLVHHETAAGETAPGWPAGGLPVSSLSYRRGTAYAAADGSGGAYIVWVEDRGTKGDIYAQRFRSDGSLAPGWPAEGLPVCTAPDVQTFPQELLLDDEGGLYVGWTDYRNVPPGSTYGADVYLSHIRPDGSSVPGWPVNGLPIAVAPGQQQFMAGGIASDGVGGVYLTWEDGRPGGSGVLVQHVRPDGTLAPGWPINGLSPAVVGDYLYDPRLCSDEAGGVYVCFTAQNTGRVRIQHLTSSGQRSPGWPIEGLAGSSFPGSGSNYPRLCADDHGGAFMVWSEVRSPQGVRVHNAYAQHYSAEGATSTLVSFAGADATAERVRLVWVLSGGAISSATVERRSEADGWQQLGAANLAEADRAIFEDRDVTPGARYAYRLSYVEGGTHVTSAESWVQVPRAAELSLRGLTPNPGVGSDLRVAFSLASSAAATLELIDVTGRRIASRDVGALGAGEHVEPLAAGAPIAPGLYWLRLTQAGAAKTARAVVTR